MGVGHSRTAVCRPFPAFAKIPLRLLFPFTVGVGQRLTSAARSSSSKFPAPRRPSETLGVGQRPREFAPSHFVAWDWLGGGPPESVAPVIRDVGKTEPPPPEVGGANGRSRYAVPDSVITELGQLPDHGSAIPVSKEPWNVLQQRPSGSHVPNGSKGFRPEIAFISSAASESREAVGLAGESRSDEVHQSGQSSKIGASHVSDDGRPIQESVPDSGLYELLAVIVNLHVADGADGQAGQAQPQPEALVATEQAQVGYSGVTHCLTTSMRS